MGFIYKVTNTLNGNVYIGQTTQTVEKRWREHRNEKYRRDFAFYRALKKYPEEVFEVEMLEEVTNDALNDREMYWIKHYDSYDNGYNSTLGGDGTRSVDHDAIINDWLAGYSVWEIAEQNNCCTQSVISVLQQLDDYTTTESRKRSSQSKQRAVTMYDLDGHTIRTYRSITDASEDIDIVRTDICSVCSGRKNTAGGYQWRYVEDDPPGKYHDNSKKPVDQYTMSGEYVNTFESIIDATKQTEASSSGIKRSCKTHGLTSGGYQWRYSGDPPPESCKSKHVCPVVKCDLDGNALTVYDTISEASRMENIDSTGICDCCNGRQRTAGGYRWRYAE